MSKKQTIITVTVLLLFLAALLCFARLQDNGQKIVLEGGRPVIVSKEPIPSDAPVSPGPEPSQSEVISYDPEETDDPDILEKQRRIRELIRNVYALRDYYVTKLHSMEADAKSEYFALPEEERTQENKEAIATRYINSAYSLEKECDAKIESICSELGELLLETNGDFSLVNKVRYSYASEKAAMKDEITQTYTEFFK